MLARVTANLLNAVKLWSNYRSQAVLSALGVIAGVAGVVIVVAVGGGAKKELDAAMGTLGAGAVLVRNAAENTENHQLTIDFVDRIQSLLSPAIETTAMVQTATLGAITQQAEIRELRVMATEGSYRSIFRLDLYGGRFIADHDIRSGQKVCVVSWEAARRLFPNGQVLGQQIKLANAWYTVVGWLQPGANKLPRLNALNLSDINLRVYTPLRLATVRSRTPLDEVVVQFNTETVMSGSLELLQRVVSRDSDEPGVELIVPIELLRQQQAMQNLFQYFLLGVAALMLAVGGVGIMNTMMLNVITRRPEIGLRVAVGATRQDIVMQFVSESLVLATAAGIVGVILGFLIAGIIDLSTSWSMAYDPAAAWLGFTVAVTVGAIFGGYPALQAASVSPIESLRKA